MDSHAVPCIEFGFDGQDYRHPVHESPQCTDSTATPGPYLRTYVVEDFAAELASLSGKQEIEVRKIDKDGKFWSMVGQIAVNSSPGMAKGLQVSRDLCNSDHGHVPVVYQEGSSCFLKMSPAQAADPSPGRLEQESAHQTGSVKIPRSFAGADEYRNRFRHRYQQYCC
jgi:hypothetical protein